MPNLRGYIWEDSPSENTPVDAENLQYLEDHLISDANNTQISNNRLLTKSNVTIATSAISSSPTYTAFPYRTTSLQTWTGLTADYQADASINPSNAYYDPFAIETYSNGYYVYFETMPTAAVVFSQITMQKGASV